MFSPKAYSFTGDSLDTWKTYSSCFNFLFIGFPEKLKPFFPYAKLLGTISH